MNAAWVFSPAGALVGEYHKHYFVRGFEDEYRSGDRIYVIDAPWGKTGVAICKDLNYPMVHPGLRREERNPDVGPRVGLGRAKCCDT